MKQLIPPDNNPTASAEIGMLCLLSHHQLQELYQQKIIDADGLRFAEKNLLTPLLWSRWVMRLCLGLGTSLLLIGVVFFFAYNWHEMPAWSKLALIEGAMLTTFVGVVLIGVKRLLGQCLLLAATVFIGVFFAVFGQIYQTGADAWQLFALWALLMLGFVLVSGFPAQWLLQSVITGTALSLFIIQNFGYLEDVTVVAIASAYLLGVWGLQLLLAKRYEWLECSWLRHLTAFAAYVALLTGFVIGLFKEEFLWALIFCTVVILSLLWHQRQHKDLLIQVFAALASAIMLWSFAFYIIIEKLKYNGFNDIVPILFGMLMVTIILSVGLYQGVVKLKHNYESANPINKGESHVK